MSKTKESTESEELRLFREYNRNPTEEFEELLLKRFEKLVYRIMKSFNIPPGDVEDIRQVGMTGLLLAIRRYDPESGNKFSTLAWPTIKGEIQRHFRDKRWALNVPRRLKEMSQKVFSAQALLAAKTDSEPTVGLIAKETGLTEEQVIEAMELGSAYNPKSFYDNVSEDDYGLYVSSEQVVERKPAEVEKHHFWEQMFVHLKEVEASVVRMRFFEGLTQKEVAEKLETSQMFVSRIQRTAIAKLRAMATDVDFDL